MTTPQCSCGFETELHTWSMQWHKDHMTHHMAYYHKHNGSTGDQAERTTIANLQMNIDVAQQLYGEIK